MDFDLSDEQRLIKDTAREFTDKEIVLQRAKTRATTTSTSSSSRRSPRRAISARSCRPSTAAPGLDYLTYGLIVEEIGRGDSAIRTVISVQTSLVCSGDPASGAPRSRSTSYLPKLCSGEWLGCFGLTEPDTGSDAANQKTRAKKVDGGWVINGAKMWISMGNYAKVALIFAQTDPELGHKGLACFLVDTDQPGYKAQTIEHKMGLHASDTGVDLARRRGGLRRRRARRGRPGLQSRDVARSTRGRYSVAAGCVGVCQGCVDESVAYAKEREQFGRPIASFQLVQAMIAEMAREHRRLADARLARRLAEGPGPRRTRSETSIAKLHATEAVV